VSERAANATTEAAIRASFGSDARDVSGNAERYWAEDVVYNEDPRWPGASTFCGRDAVVARFGEYQEAMELVGTDVEEVRVDGDAALWVVTFHVRGTGSGAPVDQTWGYTGKVRDGLLAEFTAYVDPDEARREFAAL
jgi:ketosteroid isomerase-like protein